MARPLPRNSTLEYFRKEAKAALTWHKTRDERFLPLPCNHPDFKDLTPDEFFAKPVKLTQVQHMLARAYAFPSWPALKRWAAAQANPRRRAWVAAIIAQDLDATRALIAQDPGFVNSLHLELDDPYRGNQFPTPAITYAASGPWPQTSQCLEQYRGYQPNLELMRLLLDSAADPEAWSPHGRPLSWIHNAAAARLLIAYGADLNDWKNGTPLHFACWRSRPDDMKMLLELHADPHLVHPENDEVYLHEAASMEGEAATECVRLLLEAGCDPNHPCKVDAGDGHYRIRKLIPHASYAGETPLHRAAVMGDGRRITLMLEHGANRAALTVNGETPLDWATQAGRPEDIRALL